MKFLYTLCSFVWDYSNLNITAPYAVGFHELRQFWGKVCPAVLVTFCKPFPVDRNGGEAQKTGKL